MKDDRVIIIDTNQADDDGLKTYQARLPGPLSILLGVLAMATVAVIGVAVAAIALTFATVVALIICAYAGIHKVLVWLGIARPHDFSQFARFYRR